MYSGKFLIKVRRSGRSQFKVAVAALLVGIAISTMSQAETVSQIDAVEQTYHLSSKHIVDQVIVEMHYSSSSEYRGLFGFGWCSDLDGKVEKYSDQSIRFIGCDITNANLLDPRTSANGVVKASTGYSRLREDGAVQIFDRRGRLTAVRFPETFERDTLVISYADTDRPNLLVGVRSRIDIRYDENFGLIETLRGPRQRLQFAYRLDLLVFNVTESYDYAANRGLVRRTSGVITEAVEYESERRSVARVEKRLRASPDERLLMSLVANGESGEIQINAERGAEMRPVRILYHMHRRTMDLVGDRETARRILEWIKS